MIVSALFLIQDAQNVAQFPLHRSWDDVRAVRVTTHARGERSQLRAQIQISSDGGLFFDYAHGDEHTWLQDPIRSRLFVNKGVAFQEITSRRVVTEFPVEEMPRNEALDRQPIWALLAWWPETFPLECPRVNGVPIRLPRVGGDSIDVVINEESDGRVVLKTAEEEIWLSRAHGLAISYRSWRDRESGRLLSSVEVEGFLEAAPGVWFPSSYRVRRFNPDGSLARTMEYQVLQAGVNDLEPESFTYQAPPGTFLMNAAGNEGSQITPGGFDLMEGHARSLRDQRVARKDGQSSVLWGGLAGLTAYCLCKIPWRKRR